MVSCKKEPEVVVYTNNNIPSYEGIPTLTVENYVNRIFIDLIGREPTDAEMNVEVAALEAAVLSTGARQALADKLMTSLESVEGDSTYNHAYHQKFYDDNKARFLAGLAETDIWQQYYVLYFVSVQDSLNGNTLGHQLIRAEANKVRAVLDSREELRTGTITVTEMCRRMCFNAVYDDLHMNTFNFINAAFDDLYFRYPTDEELDASMQPVESNISGVLFGQIIASKSEFLDVLLASPEYAEGMIRWAYQSLLSREPSTAEVYNLLDDFNNGSDIRAVQKSIIITDEYAGF